MRVLTICLAYLFSTVVGTLLLTLMFTAILFYDGGNITESTLKDLLFAMQIIFGGTIFAMPVAGPFILYSEIRRMDNPVQFLLAGAGAGLLIVIVFFDHNGMNGQVFSAVLGLIISASIAALTYWFIAWRLLPPANNLTEKIGDRL